ncbi:galactosyltransferase amine-terminal domain protein [Cyclospora cayetanensis]|uniref:Galactosyltransferase amine-terminal domain protein n=1 Tax=Cyclospora cayetanensis TaxID=88456 RepID=A0A1D3DB43_9EIME|nr:galactosyltransferase amine-terminal domain protein [Cyclospora cayetanensis]
MDTVGFGGDLCAISGGRMPAVVPGRAPLPFVAANAAAEQAKSDSSLDTSQRTAAASPPAEEMLIVIVPYRRRRAHLRLMLRTVTDYLEGLLQDPGEQKQREGKTCGRTDFCFIVAEQRDSRPFHRSLLLNAACLWAAQQRGWYREYSHQSSIGSDVPAVGTVRVCGAPRQRQNVTHIGGESGEGPLREKGQDSQVEICRKIQTARRVFVCLHDVDVVPRGKDFDKLARLGRPCCYFPAPQVGVARHLYGEPWSLSMVVCLRLEDVMKADGHDLRYEGWGFEDEDFLLRLQSVGVSVQRSALLPELATEGRGRAGCVSVRTQAWDSGPCCASGCCSWTFSRRLCSCAPFKELDVFSVEKLREAMAMKLRSLQGRRNRWLFCSLWPCKEDSPEGCVQQEGSSTEKRGKGLADDQQKAGYGLQKTSVLQQLGRLQITLEPLASALAISEPKQVEQQHQAQQQGTVNQRECAPPAVPIAGLAAIASRQDPCPLHRNGPFVTHNASRLATSSPVQSAANAAASATDVTGCEEEENTGLPTTQGLGKLDEDDSLRLELIAAYNPRLAWLSVTLSEGGLGGPELHERALWVGFRAP